MFFSLLFALTLVGAEASEHEAHRARFGHVTAPKTAFAMPRGSATPGPHYTVYGYHAYWNADLNAVPWDELSHLAVFQADAQIDGSLTNTSRWNEADTAVAMAAPYGVRVHLCVTNFSPTELGQLLGSSSARATLVANLKSWVDATGTHGVNIDFEGVPGSQRANMVSFVAELEAAGVGDIVLATPAVDWSDAWDYAALTQRADLFIMGYGYHWSGGSPGPVDPLYGGGDWAPWSLDWSARDYVTKGANPNRVILGLPLYGREWPVSDSSAIPATRTGDGVPVVWSAAQAESNTWGRQWDSRSLTPWWGRPGYQGWYQDLESMRARVQYATSEGLQGIGFWALHYDGGDQDLWDLIREETTLDEGGGDTGDTGDTGGADTGEVEPAVFTARAGLPFMAYPGDLVILDGRNSTGPGTLQYQWTQVAGEDPRPLGMDTAQPQFTAREPGTLIFELVVGDGEQWSEPAYSYVAVLDPSIASKGCGCSTSSTRSVGFWLTLVPVMLWLRRKTT